MGYQESAAGTEVSDNVYQALDKVLLADSR